MTNTDVPIIVCESDKEVAKQTRKLLSKDGFNNLVVYKDTKELIEDMKFVNDKGGAVLILGLSSDYSIPSLEAAQTIKTMCSNVMIIGSGVNTNNRFSISIMALQNGCDSWVEKNKKGYTVDITNKVSHWSKYIQARNKLTELYTVY